MKYDIMLSERKSDMDHEMQRKVLIVSASIGTGHTQAARAIEEYWLETEPDAQILHVDFLSTDTLSFDNILKETYIKMIDVFPMLYDLIYRLSQGERKGGMVQTLLSWILKSRMLKLITKEEPDVVIFTHPFPCGAACILKRQNLINIPLIGVITDFTSHQFWMYPQVDSYYVAIDSMVDEIARCGIDKEKIHVSGIPVRRSFFRDAIHHYELKQPVRILIMGGGLGLGSVESALRRLDDIQGVDELVVVTGQNTALYDALHDMQGELHTRTKIYGYMTNISDIMKNVSLLVTKPGALTCMEAITMGLPMVFFNAIPGQEEANAAFLEGKGCARWARDIHNLEDVVTALLINPQRLQQMSQCSLEWHVDGAANVVHSIISLLDVKKTNLSSAIPISETFV